MEEATRVDVISTRFQMAKSEKAKEEASRRSGSNHRIADDLYRATRFMTAGEVKKELEGGSAIAVWQCKEAVSERR